ncbi:MAG: SRPBCC family protein [Prevotellaceae bacterium]|jgi:carbon monoxide dehydrogenase subunit G|nr:SRPBCC family protein [Prevotellaceae bacterium]
MDEFISDIVKINRSAEQVYGLMADMSFFSQMASSAPIRDVEDFQSTQDTCSFKVKGIEVGVQIIDREPYKTIKYTGYKYSPVDFFIWLQLKEIAPDDTRIRIVFKAKLNLMMKTVFKGKIKKGLDKIVHQISDSLNRS